VSIFASLICVKTDVNPIIGRRSRGEICWYPYFELTHNHDVAFTPVFLNCVRRHAVLLGTALERIPRVRMNRKNKAGRYNDSSQHQQGTINWTLTMRKVRTETFAKHGCNQA
jgi:hypothetical protein